MSAGDGDVLFQDSGGWISTRTKMNQLRQEGCMLDLIIKIGNETLKCHKCIAQTHIPYLHEEIKKKEKELFHPTNYFPIEIDLNNNIKPSIFELILDFVYLGTVQLNKSNVTDLMAAANFLKIKELTEICSHYFTEINQMEVENQPCSSAEQNEVPNEGAKKPEDHFYITPLNMIKSTNLYINNVDDDNMVIHQFYLSDKIDLTPLLIVGNHSEKCVVVVNDQVVYAFGGIEKNHKVKETWRLNLQEREWVLLRSLNIARCGSAGCFFQNRIYTVGGIGETELSSLEMYDIAANHWKLLSSMYYSRVNAALIALDNFLWCFGGISNKETSSKIECYDIKSNKWMQQKDMPFKRSGMGIAELDGCIIIAGGRNEHFMKTDSVYKFDPKTSRWSEFPSLLRARANFSFYSYFGYLVAVGGDQFHVREHTIEVWNPKTNRWRVTSKYNNNALLEVCIV